jgi:predicted component of type VI protein secretion system
VELLISVHSNENGALKSARCSLDGAVTLGRGPESPVLLDGNGISREHLRLHSDGDGIFITDLSSNGTWLNTQRLTRGEPHPLTPADAIKIPGFEIRIDLQDTSAADGRQARAGATVVSKSTAAPVRTNGPHKSGPIESGPLKSLRVFGASLSKVEGLLIALALATLAMVALYLAA